MYRTNAKPRPRGWPYEYPANYGPPPRKNNPAPVMVGLGAWMLLLAAFWPGPYPRRCAQLIGTKPHQKGFRPLGLYLLRLSGEFPVSTCAS